MDKKGVYILEQVCKLYKRYGIKSVTMDDVARHLCISKKTLYEHFHDKEALVKEVMLLEHEHRNKVIREIESQGMNSIEELIEVYQLIQKMFREYNPSMEYDLRKYYPDLFNKIKDIRRKTMFESTQRNMNKGKKEGLYRKDINSAILSKLHVFRVENLFENDLFTLEELATFKVIHEIFVYHLHGIMSLEGLKVFEKNFAKIKAGLG
jgi:TetR/AcrR family transcriptional regulator, cholesterol catabolism regulator